MNTLSQRDDQSIITGMEFIEPNPVSCAVCDRAKRSEAALHTVSYNQDCPTFNLSECTTRLVKYCSRMETRNLYSIMQEDFESLIRSTFVK